MLNNNQNRSDATIREEDKEDFEDEFDQKDPSQFLKGSTRRKSLRTIEDTAE